MPSVTQVLRPWRDFSGVDPDTLEAAAARGVRVHSLCAAMAQGLWIPEVPEDCAGYVQSFMVWLEEAVSEVAAVETTLTDKVYRFTGTPDLICRIKHDRMLTLADLKTPQTHEKAWRLQLAAYKRLGEVNSHLFRRPIARVMSIQLSREGKPPKVTEYTNQANQDFAVFLACLQAWRFFHGD